MKIGISVVGVNTGLELLSCLLLHNTTKAGVLLAPGPHRLRPAVLLQGDTRDLRIPKEAYLQAIEMLHGANEFTITAYMQQDMGNSGTLVSFSYGVSRYLEVASSGRRDEVRLHYRGRDDGLVRMEAMRVHVADGLWHRVSVSVSGRQLRLFVDCQPIETRLLPQLPDMNFSYPQLALYLGQRNQRHSYFKGILQEVRLIPGPLGYLWECPLLAADCPTCGQYAALETTVNRLYLQIQLLSRQLAVAEERLSKLEYCECRKSCLINGTFYEDGDVWKAGCELCKCKFGDKHCQPLKCPPVACKNPVTPEGECCPQCLKQCYHMKTLYEHGERTSPKPCLECVCEDGSMSCTSRDPSLVCPPLSCPASVQFSVPGECCKFCPGIDYCTLGGHAHCHVNATCINLSTTFACHCGKGFYGDGFQCHDVDECIEKGGVDGNYCHTGTVCENTIGGYECHCLDGHQRVDRYHCAETDECSAGTHSCHANAKCVNTKGSYNCQCLPGYTGDGFHCEPMCSGICENGGRCIAPGVCGCRKGFHGPHCEFDVDECQTGLHTCQETSSTCVNMPGWYYCRCRPGYKIALLPPPLLDTVCEDENECLLGTHTCHPSATCVNTPGSFSCVCHHDDNDDDGHNDDDDNDDDEEESHQLLCKQSCIFEGHEVSNHAIVSPRGMPCRQCECINGVILCRDPECDCSKPGTSRDRCCPQCDPRAACRHQELRHVVFRSGDRWIYQCQTCECLFGEIDCWELECPPITCDDPFLAIGDCCPRCSDDPCFPSSVHNSTNGTITLNASLVDLYAVEKQQQQLGTITDQKIPQLPCMVTGRLHASGLSWLHPHDSCTTCSCQNGQLRCSYNLLCRNRTFSTITTTAQSTTSSPLSSNRMETNVFASSTTTAYSNSDNTISSSSTNDQSTVSVSSLPEIIKTRSPGN